MSKRRVMLVDDAIIIRKLVSESLNADPDIEVVGTAPNGKVALEKLSSINPDCLILDIEMPEMDGLETLRNLKQSHPRLPVIMFSTLSERGTEMGQQAMGLGARYCVAKPSNVGSINLAMKRVREEIVPMIKSLCPR